MTSTLRSSRARRLLAAIYLLGSIAVALIAFAAAAFKCDESCFNNGGDWRYDSSAWQWPAIGVLGGAALVLAVVVVLASRFRPRLAWAPFAAHVLAVVALIPLFDVRWRSMGAFAALVLVELCGLAVALRSGDGGRRT